MKLFRGSRLAARIWIIGLVQFLVVAAGMEMNRRANRPTGQPFQREAVYVAEDLARVSDDPVALQAELARAQTMLRGGAITIRDANGEVVAEIASTHGLRGPRGAIPIALKSGAGKMEYTMDRGPPPGPGFTVPIVLVLFVVGVSAWLTARSLTRPLAQLSGVAREFGAGKLDVRTKLDRADEIGDMGRAFDEMADRIARLLLAERELLANLSHELRTPLARIRVALDLANEGDPAEAAASLGEIAEDLAELERLVDDVLAAARLAHQESRAGSKLPISIRTEHIDIGALLERSAAKFRSAHPKRTLEVIAPDDLPALTGDPVLVRRVIDNVLDNAHKYTEDASAAIALEGRRDGDGVVIEVRDRGIGIADDDLGRLFEPFFRADRSRTRATGGLGLGLALARRVVEAHEGTIAVTSELGKGTIVRIRLPLLDRTS